MTAAVFTRWSASRYGCEVIGDPTLAAAWEFVHRRCAELATASIEMDVDATSPVSAAEAVRAGFTERGETIAVSWLDAADRAAVRALPDGYTLVARPEQDGPHPMIKRNGAHVEARLPRLLPLRPRTGPGAADRRRRGGRLRDVLGRPRPRSGPTSARASALISTPSCTDARPAAPESEGLFRVGGQTVGSNTDQQISLRRRWSSRTSSRIASGSCSRCQLHSSRPAPSVVPAGPAARAALIA